MNRERESEGEYKNSHSPPSQASHCHVESKDLSIPRGGREKLRGSLENMTDGQRGTHQHLARPG